MTEITHGIVDHDAGWPYRVGTLQNISLTQFGRLASLGFMAGVSLSRINANVWGHSR
jgi:hypothetical protein